MRTVEFIVDEAYAMTISVAHIISVFSGIKKDSYYIEIATGPGEDEYYRFSGTAEQVRAAYKRVRGAMSGEIGACESRIVIDLRHK
jgi:hypothetical protein